MATPTTPTPDTDDLDARYAAHQILGDAYNAYTGDWHQALRQAAADYSATTAPAPAA